MNNFIKLYLLKIFTHILKFAEINFIKIKIFKFSLYRIICSNLIVNKIDNLSFPFKFIHFVKNKFFTYFIFHSAINYLFNKFRIKFLNLSKWFIVISFLIRFDFIFFLLVESILFFHLALKIELKSILWISSHAYVEIQICFVFF